MTSALDIETIMVKEPAMIDIEKEREPMDFDQWWYAVGSGLAPKKGEDMECHAKRVAYAAWQAATQESGMSALLADAIEAGMCALLDAAEAEKRMKPARAENMRKEAELLRALLPKAQAPALIEKIDAATEDK